jgi:hypothetical protein
MGWLELIYDVASVDMAVVAIIAILVHIERMQKETNDIYKRRDRMFGRRVTTNERKAGQQ